MKIIITEKQNDLLNENFPIGLRRRFDYNMIKDHLIFSITESIDPCDFTYEDDFIGEMCNMLANDLIDDYYETGGGEIIYNKTKDDLYYFIADNFAGYLQEIYNKECN